MKLLQLSACATELRQQMLLVHFSRSQEKKILIFSKLGACCFQNLSTTNLNGYPLYPAESCTVLAAALLMSQFERAVAKPICDLRT